ncbi:MAG: alpha/beta fold hydrolase [Rhodobacterales bacterium]|nr:alpha/beta fold hydrolase [Rhodobacterales bacterium]
MQGGLHVRQIGQGAQPMLALHCALAHGGIWAGLAALRPDLRLIAPDLPGHGKSPDWDGGPDLHGQATRAAAALIQAQGAPLPVLGHSFGATVALRLALERPDLVTRLVLVEPVLFAAARAAGAACYPAFAADHHAIAVLVQAGAMGAAAERFHARWGAGALADLPPWQRDYVVARMPLVMAQNGVLERDDAGLLAPWRLEGLGLPVDLVEGTESPPVVAAIHDELARRLPQVRRTRVAGAGHMLPLTHPAALAAVI